MTRPKNQADHGKRHDWILGAAWVLFLLMLASTRSQRGDRVDIALAILGLCEGLLATPLFLMLAGSREARQVVYDQVVRKFGRPLSLAGFAALVTILGLSGALGQYLLKEDALLQQLLGVFVLALATSAFAAMTISGFLWLRARTRDLTQPADVA